MRLPLQVFGRPIKIGVTNGRLVPRKGANYKQINRNFANFFFFFFLFFFFLTTRINHFSFASNRFCLKESVTGTRMWTRTRATKKSLLELREGDVHVFNILWMSSGFWKTSRNQATSCSYSRSVYRFAIQFLIMLRCEGWFVYLLGPEVILQVSLKLQCRKWFW